MKIKIMHPLISCICITAHRPEFLLKTIISFDQQNYPHTELVISYPEDDRQSALLIENVLKLTSIKIIPVKRKSDDTIGMARNNAVAASNGEYVCMWDDDDIYQFSRIADQHNLLQGHGRYYEASILTRIILHDALLKMSYVSSYKDWSCTLLCNKKYLLSYPCTDTDHAELLPVINYLKTHHLLFEIPNNPLLYVNVFHGQNLLHYFDFRQFLKESILIEQAYSNEIERHLAEQVSVNI